LLAIGEEYLEVRILKDFKYFRFGSADSKRVTGAFFGSADSKRFTQWSGRARRRGDRGDQQGCEVSITTDGTT